MRQLISYGVVGVVSNLIIYLFYLLITHGGVEPKTAMTFLYIIAASTSFFVYKKFTFFYERDVLNSGARYVTAHMFGFLLNWIILNTFVERLNYPHQIVQAVAVFVVAVFLFVVFNLFVFKRQ
jgi:putative flippase GtrA